MKRLIAYCFFSVSCTLYLLSQSASTILSSNISELNFENAIVGISLIDPEGKEVFGQNSSIKFIPASTLKLVTTFSAIDVLGPDFTYTTSIGYSGELLRDGTLSGNIIIRGSGDPSLGSPDYDPNESMSHFISKVYDEITELGITCIDGNIIVDPSIFDSEAVHRSWNWDDLTNYYATGVWGFNLNENQYSLYFERNTTEGAQTGVAEIEPEVPGLFIDNRVRIGANGTGDNAYLFGNPYDSYRWVEGTIPPGTTNFKIKGAIPNPAHFTSWHLTKFLSSNGIAVKGHNIDGSSEVKKWFAQFSSDPLSKMAIFANDKSNNLFCDAFLKTLPQTQGASFESGVAIIEENINQRGLNTAELKQVDGSGLSSRNRITPRFEAMFVSKYLEVFGADVVKNYIPKVGEDGSVRNFLNGLTAQEGAWLKSGSINNVLAYAGLITGKSGRLYSFSIMANGHNSNYRMRRNFAQIIQMIHENY